MERRGVVADEAVYSFVGIVICHCEERSNRKVRRLLHSAVAAFAMTALVVIARNEAITESVKTKVRRLLHSAVAAFAMTALVVIARNEAITESVKTKVRRLLHSAVAAFAMTKLSLPVKRSNRCKRVIFFITLCKIAIMSPP